jgi:hypothetical protein
MESGEKLVGQHGARFTASRFKANNSSAAFIKNEQNIRISPFLQMQKKES